MHRSVWVVVLSLVLTSAVLNGCVHVRLDASTLLKPDQRPGSVRLAEGYRVEEGAVIRADRMIGITRAHRPGNRAVILYCGGDSFRRSRDGGTVLQHLAVDADVVLFDYPGFGDSTGLPTPETLIDNARAIHRFLGNLPTTQHQKVVLYGFSLGGMVAAQLVREAAIDALVLESTAADVASWAWTQVPWYAVPFVRIDVDPALARIDNVRALHAFSGTVLILSGTNDRSVPESLSRGMHARLKTAGVDVELAEFNRAGHGEIHRSPDFRRVLAKFLADL